MRTCPRRIISCEPTQKVSIHAALPDIHIVFLYIVHTYIHTYIHSFIYSGGIFVTVTIAKPI